MIIDVLQVPVPKDRLSSMLNEERTVFLMLGYAANQIMITDVANVQNLALTFFVVTRDDASFHPITSQPDIGAAESQGPLWFWLEGC